MIIDNSMYDKKFCLFDEISIPICDISEYDEDLKRALSYHPIHNEISSIKNNISFDKNYLYDVNREIIETDRSGFRGYHKIYSYYISKFKNQRINLLEIGIQHGYGLLAWSRYFKKSFIYGMEVKEKFSKEYDVIKEKFPDESKRIRFDFPYSSVHEENWNKLYSDVKFDVIIDDGSHKIGHQLKTLINSIKCLKEKNSYYFIEDIKIEYFNDEQVIALYDRFEKIKKMHRFKEMIIYRHIHPERILLLTLDKKEKSKYYFSRGQKRMMDVYLEKDTKNYYNYMITFSR